MTSQLADLPCRDIVEIVTAYLEGALDEELHSRFEAHLAICDSCVAYVEQMRRTVAAAGQAVEPEQLPADLREGLRRAFRDWAHAP